ncbi:short-chain dehydrogenase [Durotheca rogersii]|uniref:short-chain dehydrogenase n=1 Tax=Durotheca rogersii TaxID=419775 RepID=UPI0022208E3E|nr:short-chain dehydrogenase [Durotheca rogersii]KAI5866008.1 short-chain dehydrogenase [Durotheca rogersii]
MPSSSNKPLILITGANQGLGYATAKILADTGKYHVILGSRSVAKGEEAIAKLKSENADVDTSALTPVVLDVTDDASIEAARDLVKEKFGHLDILINSAGVNGQIPVRKPGLRENYQFVFDVNVFGVAVLTETFLPLLRASPYQDRRVVNVTTGLGQIGVALATDTIYNAASLPAPEYRSSKAALNMLTAVDASRLKPENITVVAVAPGHTKTQFTGNRGVKEPSQGAANIVRAAIEGKPEDLYGKLQAEELVEYGW